MKIEGAYKIEQIFKAAAGLRLPKNKVAEIEQKVDSKLYDMLVTAEESAGYNARDVIWLSDVPLTKAMKDSMMKFRELEEELQLEPLLEKLASRPPLKYELEVALEKRLPEIAGTLIYILAKITKEFSPGDNLVSEDELKRAFRVLDLTV
ncbi:hypothetical protein NNO_2149 [Hydrogenimonas sp.]|nr:hypothetical protein NNO_2149 [Hydrogenimonas sp.]